jgi:dTDP-glucose 4,6-dehydratase
VVQVSTDEVYGSIASGSWTEDTLLAPNSPYAAAKAGGDLIARAYARTHGLNVSITRFCNNYGPYQYPEKVIPLFVTNLLEGRQVPLYGDGGNVRGWIHVDDHCRGVQLVLEHGDRGGIYHINGDVELTNLELTAAILESCGATWDMVTLVEDRKGHDRRYSLDDSALRAVGYAPLIPFVMGLRSTVRWYVENRDWWERLKRPGQDKFSMPVSNVSNVLAHDGGLAGRVDGLSLVPRSGPDRLGCNPMPISRQARRGRCLKYQRSVRLQYGSTGFSPGTGARCE